MTEIGISMIVGKNRSAKDHQVNLLACLHWKRSASVNLLKKLNEKLLSLEKYFILSHNADTFMPEISDRRQYNFETYIAPDLTQPTSNVDYANENNTFKISFHKIFNEIYWLSAHLAHSLISAITNTYTRICGMCKNNNQLTFKDHFLLGSSAPKIIAYNNTWSVTNG